MKAHHTLANDWSVLTLIYFSLLSSAALLTAGTAFAQGGGSSTGGLAVAGVALLVMFLIFAALYVYTSLALQTIAKKTNTENGWLAWIPIANIFLMLNISKKPLWWFILCLIPLVDIVVIIIVWMAIAEARGKPSWWGILLIVPVVNLIVPGYLAWAE